MDDSPCDSCSHEYSAPVFDEVEAVVAGVVKRFKRKRAPADFVDLHQEGIRIALSTLDKYGERAWDKGYLHCAVRRELGNYLSKQVAVCTIKDNWTMARTIVGTSLDAHRGGDDEGPPLQLVDKGPQPDDGLMHRAGARQASRWRIDFRRALDRVLFPFDDVQREIIEELYGLGGTPSKLSGTIARERDIPVRDIYRLADKFKRRLHGDIEFYMLNSRLHELRW